MKDTTIRKIFGADIEAPFFTLDRGIDLGLAPFSEQIMKERIPGFTFDEALKYVREKRIDYSQTFDQIGSIFIWDEEQHGRVLETLLSMRVAELLMRTGAITLEEGYRKLPDKWWAENLDNIAEEWAKEKGFPRKHSVPAGSIL